MSLWIEKYRPKNFNQITFNKKVITRLKNIIKSGSVNHLIIQGPVGSGKKTIINSFLKEIYGESIESTDNLYFPLNLVEIQLNVD